MTEIGLSFGEQIRLLRKRNHLTLAEVGKATRIHPNQLSEYENNKRNPSTETVKKLAKYYNISSDSLIGVSKATANLNLKEHLESKESDRIGLIENISERLKSLSEAAQNKMAGIILPTLELIEKLERQETVVFAQTRRVSKTKKPKDSDKK